MFVLTGIQGCCRPEHQISLSSRPEVYPVSKAPGALHLPGVNIINSEQSRKRLTTLLKRKPWGSSLLVIFPADNAWVETLTAGIDMDNHLGARQLFNDFLLDCVSQSMCLLD
jgi:hypothetical protein